MAECTVSHQVLKELYHEIYKLHWSYLELEDGMQKLEEQKLLEALLKKFLCVVPHNRKFFLPETYSVFKRTVTQMKDFSVVKMLNGFESISQYANNLFTKPWRKEYRTIKTYSGFFVHEIKSNLIDPEELFVAMGYKKTANHELILDGEICPDQVMNMSRDAMTAYTECKILNRIHSELTKTYNINCSWLDIFNYRESHTGGVTETIEAIRNLIQRNVCVGGNGTTMMTTTSREKLQQSQLGPSCFSSAAVQQHQQHQQAHHQQQMSGNGLISAGQTTCPATACNMSTNPEYYPSSSNHNNYHHHQANSACPLNGGITGQGQLPPTAMTHHHQQQQQPPVDLMTQSLDNSNYYQHHSHHPSHGAPQNTINGSLSSAVAHNNNNNNLSSACSMHPNAMSYSSVTAGHSNNRMGMDQSIYAPRHQQYHHQHPQQPSQQASSASICDYSSTTLPHSKSLDHYSYPTVLGELQQAHRSHASMDSHPHNHHPHHHLHQMASSGAQGHNNNSMGYLDGSNGNGGQFSRSQGNVSGMMGTNGYYEPMPSGHNNSNTNGNSSAAAYNVSGTRYPLPYSLSAQFGQSSGGGVGVMEGGCGGNNWGSHYEVPNNNNINNGLMLTGGNPSGGGGPVNYPPECLATSHHPSTSHQGHHQRGNSIGNAGGPLGHMTSRSSTHVPPIAQPQYYSELIKPTEGHQHHHLPSPGMGGGNYGESSDEVDRFNGGQQLLLQPQQQQMRSGNKSAMKDHQQQTPRSSDFDSYEELYGNNGGAVVVDHKMGSARKINSNNNNITNSNSNKPRPDKVQDGVGSFESWDYVYQSLDQDTRRPAAVEQAVRANGRTSGGNGGMSSKEAAIIHNNKTKTMTRQEASKIQEHISNLRAVKPSTTVPGEDEGRQRMGTGTERRSSSGGHHQKSNSIGGSSLVVNGTGGHHQRQASDSGLNGGHRVGSAGGRGAGGGRMARESEFSVDSLPPPLLTSPGDDQEWSCRFCTFLNENSRRICEMCAKSKDFVLDSSASSATCV